MKIALLLGWFFLVSCDACQKTKPKKAHNISTTRLGPLVLDTKKLLSSDDVDKFTLDFELTISISDGIKTESQYERVRLLVQKPLMTLIKKIGQERQIQIFRQGEEWLIRQDNGPFHNVRINKEYYQKLWKDSANSLDWLITEFGLEHYFNAVMENGAVYIENASLNNEAPFIKNIQSQIPQFSSLKSSSISGTFNVDKHLGIINNARVEVALLAKNQHWVKIMYALTLNPSVKEKLVWPTAINEDPVLVPAQVKENFLKIFKSVDETSKK